MDLSEDDCVRVWRSRLGSSWSGAYRVFCRFYRETLVKDEVLGGFSPSRLVDWQAKANGWDRYRILRLAQTWVDRQGLRYSTKKTRLSWVRSFFLHNLAELPSDEGFQFKAENPPVEGKLDFESFRRILHNCNKMYRAVFLMMAQGLMGEGEVVYVSNHLWREVLQHLTKNDGFFKVVLPGRKKNRNIKNYYTILSTNSDWAEAMRDYMKSSPKPVFGALFWNEHGKPLNRANIQYYFHCRAIEVGVVTAITPNCNHCGGETLKVRRGTKIGYKCRECNQTMLASQLGLNLKNARYGVNPHEIRDLMRSRWQVSGADSVVADFILGHEIDPNNYNKFMKYEPWYPLAEYQKALPWLNILSEDPEKVSRSTVDAELETYRNESQILRREVTHLSQYVQTLENQLKKQPAKTPEEQQFLDDIARLFKEKPETRTKFLKLLEQL